MTNAIDQPGSNEPVPSVVTVAHIVYALHAFAIVVGVVTSVAVATSFVASLPSIVAVIINYVKRSDARGSWAESHYRWQIRTFWFALLWFVVGWLLIITLVFAVVGIPILIALTLWLIYRIARGWLRLLDRKPMYV
jgi:uncharacterized membrane protein